VTLLNKFVVRVALFGILLKLLLCVLDLRLPFYYGDSGLIYKNVMHTKYNHLVDNNEKYNSIFVGSSISYRQVNSALFDSLSCIKTSSFNFGNPGTLIPESFYILENTIESLQHKPEYVFLELMLPANNMVNGFAMDSPKWRYYLNSSYFKLHHKILNTSFLMKKNAKNFINNFLGVGLIKLKLLYFSGLIEQHDEILGTNNDGYLSLDLEFNTSPNEELISRKQLFKTLGKRLFKKRLNEIKESGSFKESDYVSAPIISQKVQELISLAEEKSIHLFIFVPQYELYKESIQHVFDQIPAENRLSVSDIEEFPFLENMDFYYDHGHLNARGAKLFTEALAKKFNESVDCIN